MHLRPLVLAVLAASLAVPASALAYEPQVAGLQVALRAKGAYAGPIDAIRGPLTIGAVKRFQRRAGLGVDGVAGPHTRRALGRLGRPLYGKRMLVRGRRGWDVSVVQFLLLRQGFPVGNFDGVFGPRTAEAVRAFQRWHGLAPDGAVGPSTRRALRIAPQSFVIKARVRQALDYWASAYGVNRKLVRALAWIESGYQPQVVSRTGAWGIMQVMPATWNFVEAFVLRRQIGPTPSGNVRVGVAYLYHLLRRYDGRRRPALAAYNQGPGSLDRRGMLPETRRFVRAVLALARRI
jgi:peptidoglycan hydrolase-like protein with peptidoglycan-binding domain